MIIINRTWQDVRNYVQHFYFVTLAPTCGVSNVCAWLGEIDVKNSACADYINGHKLAISWLYLIPIPYFATWFYTLRTLQGCPIMSVCRRCEVKHLADYLYIIAVITNDCGRGALCCYYACPLNCRAAFVGFVCDYVIPAASRHGWRGYVKSTVTVAIVPLASRILNVVSAVICSRSVDVKPAICNCALLGR